ncbi:MAG TPA: NRDE family protein [Usitatibacter sp.]|nr:NRDE family protein [Usitatibacter sp.]
MCLIVIAWKARDDLPLIVAANRDEWRDRPAEPAQWWHDDPALLAGRDLQAGGTWMGITRGGRFAAVTNFRDPSQRRTSARSRGAIVARFLQATERPRLYLERLAATAAEYNGFNLMAGTPDELWYFGSREGEARLVDAGVHGISNHLLDEPWPKVVRARAEMQAALAEADPFPRLFDLLSDTAGAPDEVLPDTGVGLAWERRLAATLITGEDYGTRCSTVIARAADGTVRFEERTRAADGSVASTAQHRFALADAFRENGPVAPPPVQPTRSTS